MIRNLNTTTIKAHQKVIEYMAKLGYTGDSEHEDRATVTKTMEGKEPQRGGIVVWHFNI